VFLLAACAGRPAAPRSSAESRTASAPRQLEQQIHARTDLQLERAILIKPAATVSEQSQGWILAPLLLQEITPQLQPASDTTNRTVHFSERQVWINDIPHQQVAYYWTNTATDTGREGVSLQGVRITTDSLGTPVIWEVFTDSSGAKPVYVARSLETAVSTALGGALPGRRFAVEQRRPAPGVVVARMIDDAPVPMGPIVHVRAGNGDVATLICRCMPSQVKELAGYQWYELQPIEGDEGAWIQRATRGSVPAAQLEDWLNPRRLQALLRLPPSF